nr:MAG TPA: upper collar protein [Caudoviricetes sp.]
MKKKKNQSFHNALMANGATYVQYYNRLMELSMSMFKWKNLPDTVDERYLELGLFSSGCMVFFKDDVIGELALNMTYQGGFDIYGEPTKRRAYSRYNQFQTTLDKNNSVIIWNNMLRTNSALDVQMFAYRLYNLDRIVDINANAQKTPVLITCDEKQKLTMKNLYMQYEGNYPVIFGDSNLDIKSLSVLKTDAPFVSDKIYDLKVKIWNEALTYLGISNINSTKKERMIIDEVIRNQGGTIASRYSRLESRRRAIKKINKMFGLNITVDYREDFQSTDIENDTLGGDTIE